MDILEPLARTVVVALVLWPFVVLVARRRAVCAPGEVDTLPRPEESAPVGAPDRAHDGTHRGAHVRSEDAAEQWVRAG